MAPQFVKPYVKTNKHDAADAEAICEAVTRPNMRFVPVKTAEQQAVLALHRSRQSFIKQRTAQANQIRGYWPNLALSSPEVSSSYSDDYLSSWKMRITRYRPVSYTAESTTAPHGVPVRCHRYTRQAD